MDKYGSPFHKMNEQKLGQFYLEEEFEVKYFTYIFV